MSQREALGKLHISLAEHGYYIFPIKPKLRRHKLDFIAVLNVPPLNFVLVRPTLKGRISVMPFGPRSQYVYAHRAIFSARKGTAIRIDWNRRQLHRPPNGEWWKFYFSKHIQEEVGELLGLK